MFQLIFVISNLPNVQKGSVCNLRFQDLVKKTDLYAFFIWFFFTRPLNNVADDYVWNPKSVGSRAKKLWAVTFLPLEAAGGLN